MKISICDDEFLFRKSLIDILEKNYIVFLDIEMNQLNGIETAKQIREVDDNVIIIF